MASASGQSTPSAVRRPGPPELRRSGAVAAALLLALHATAHAAIVQYQVRAVSPFDEAFIQDERPLGSGFNEAISLGNSSAALSVQPGVLRLRAETSWTAGLGGQHGASASVTIFDTIIIQPPPVLTTFGVYLTADISVSGSLAQSGGTASWRATAQLLAPPYRGAGFELVSPASQADVRGEDSARDGVSGASLPALVSTVTPTPQGFTGIFLYNTPIDLRLTFSAAADGSASAPSGSGGFARARLEDTLIWLGLTARDAEGNIIEGVTFTSASGIDWGNPPAVIPLPAAGWLLLTAFGVLGGMAGMRRA